MASDPDGYPRLAPFSGLFIADTTMAAEQLADWLRNRAERARIDAATARREVEERQREADEMERIAAVFEELAGRLV
jgi:hypothetical protein